MNISRQNNIKIQDINKKNSKRGRSANEIGNNEKYILFCNTP